MRPDKTPSSVAGVSMQDMTTLIAREFKDASQTINNWIKENILLPKISGTIRDALYPAENHTRILVLKTSGLIQAGKKVSYLTLRLVLWLNGFSVPVKKDLLVLTGGTVQSLKKNIRFIDNPALNNELLDLSLVPIHPLITSTLQEDEEIQDLPHVSFESFVDNLGMVFPSPNPDEDKTKTYKLDSRPQQLGDVDTLRVMQNLMTLFGSRLKLDEDVSTLVQGLSDEAVGEMGKQIGVLLHMFTLPFSVYFETESGKGIFLFAMGFFLSSLTMVNQLSHSPQLVNKMLSSLAGRSWSEDLVGTFSSRITSKEEEVPSEKERKLAPNETVG